VAHDELTRLADGHFEVAVVDESDLVAVAQHTTRHRVE
jgi:hypothetical protein